MIQYSKLARHARVEYSRAFGNGRKFRAIDNAREMARPNSIRGTRRIELDVSASTSFLPFVSFRRKWVSLWACAPVVSYISCSIPSLRRTSHQKRATVVTFPRLWLKNYCAQFCKTLSLEQGRTFHFGIHRCKNPGCTGCNSNCTLLYLTDYNIYYSAVDPFLTRLYRTNRTTCETTFKLRIWRKIVWFWGRQNMCWGGSKFPRSSLLFFDQTICSFSS